MQRYLESSTYIDWTHPEVRMLAGALAGSESSRETIIKNCFEFVRDEIRHCSDHNDEVLTAKASEVLEAGTGFCFAQSHLLAALLRANNIPAALCYQRFKGEERYTLHGLNAVHLGKSGWYRIDARGNKVGVNAEFTPPVEQLAFPLEEGDEDVPGYWSEPLTNVIDVLTGYDCVSDAREHLPGSVG